MLIEHYRMKPLTDMKLYKLNMQFFLKSRMISTHEQS